MLPSCRVVSGFCEDLYSLCLHLLIGGHYVAGLDLAGKYAVITKLWLKLHIVEFPFAWLPDLESSTALKVDDQDRISWLWLSTCIWKHSFCHSYISQNFYIYTEYILIPWPGLFHASHADADLLDTAYYFSLFHCSRLSAL